MERWEDWVVIDSDRQKLMMRQALESLAAFATGAIKENDDGMFFGGTYLGRPFRVFIDETSGRPKVMVKTKPIEDRGYLNIRFDPNAGPLQAEDPEWEEDRPKNVRVFIAPGLYFEDYPDDVTRMQAMLTPLLPGLVQQLLQSTNQDCFGVDNDDGKIELDLDDSAHLMRGELVPRVQHALDGIERIARELGV